MNGLIESVTFLDFSLHDKTQIMIRRARHYNNSTTTTTTTTMQQQQQQQDVVVDDADVAAGNTNVLQSFSPTRNNNNDNKQVAAAAAAAAQPPSSFLSIESAPSSAATINTSKGHPMDLEFFEDLVSEPVLVLGMDISHLHRQTQFVVCATGVFGFSLLYGYLQELIAVRLCNRNLGLFQAVMQFSGYTVLAYFLRNFVYLKEKQRKQQTRRLRQERKQQQQQSSNSSGTLSLPSGDEESAPESLPSKLNSNNNNNNINFCSTTTTKGAAVPLILYLGLSLLRAVDLAMTNLAMQYINYPAKTLMKSSRVVFTMLFGVVISRKTYHTADYLIVLCMVAGLALFMHADANSSAVFHHVGVLMLTISLVCDGAISNVSETIMSKYGVGQDEFIFRMYSIALVAIVAAAAVKGDLQDGLYWLRQPGTYDEVWNDVPLEERTWSVPSKLMVMLLFSSMGFFGSSCSAAITKNFGALTMSITSTARKATTLFLSFFLFNNVCTTEHVGGVVMFIAALTAKSLRRGRKRHKHRGKHHKHHHHHNGSDRHHEQQHMSSAERQEGNDWLHNLMMRQSRQKEKRRKQERKRLEEQQEQQQQQHRSTLELALPTTPSRLTDEQRPLLRRVSSREGPPNSGGGSGIGSPVRRGRRPKKNGISNVVHIV